MKVKNYAVLYLNASAGVKVLNSVTNNLSTPRIQMLRMTLIYESATINHIIQNIQTQ